MAITGNFKVKAIHVILCLALFSCVVNGVSLRHRRYLLEDGGLLTPTALALDDSENVIVPVERKLEEKEKKNQDKKKSSEKEEDPSEKKKSSSKEDKSPSEQDKSPSEKDKSPSEQDKSPSEKDEDPSKKKSKKAAPPSKEPPPEADAPPADTPPAEEADPSKSGASSNADTPPAEGAPSVPDTTPVTGAPSGTVYDVTQFGAKADDKTDSAMAFIKAWKAACTSSKPATVLVPKGNFLIGPVLFEGPCTANAITFELQGTVKATTDLSAYSSPEWISFERISGLVVKGSGVFDGQGASAWKVNDCAKSGKCADLPDQLKFLRVSNGDVSGITSLNSKYFHYHVVTCDNINFHDIKITAPADSPNTDGLHISDSHGITVANSVIGTGDDCVSIGDGTTNLKVTGVNCGPGHGISVGSLGKYKNEKEVNGISVTNCVLHDTDNGARIKTYAGSEPSVATNIVFEDITMNNVKNPIIIDSHYGSKSSAPSRVKLNDVHFRNIKGTSTSEVAVTLDCSSAAPCDQVELADIHFTAAGGSGALKSLCENAKIQATGVVNPSTCSA